MKNKIASVFYDKTVEVVESQTTIDAEGGVKYNGSNVVDTFKGNVNFSNCKQIQEEYGLDYNIDISITTDYELLKHNDLIKYQDVTYNVTDVFKRDSHNLIVATKWQQ
jgi:hypothetical protein